jgi:polyphosphate kinase
MAPVHRATVASLSSVESITGPTGEAVDERFVNRELSWLDFDERVLELAEDASLPLLERVKFCAIFSSNLDEFYQVRVAALHDQVAAGVLHRSPDGRTPGQQLLAIADRVNALVRRQDDLVTLRLLPSLATAGIRLVAWDDLGVEQAKQLSEWFEARVFPVLTPLAVDPAHPFPYISNLSLNLAVVVRDPETDERRFARVKVPEKLPRFVALADGAGWVLLEEIIAAKLDALFVGMEIVEHRAFRVTRNADLSLEDEDAEDLLAAVEMELRRRRFGRAVRLECDERISAELVQLLLEELDLDPEDMSFHRAALALNGLTQLLSIDRPDLRDEPWVPITPARLAEAAEAGRSIFSVVRERDVLVHHPYESFADSVEELIRQASVDPKVLTIKTTLYRTSGDSPIARALIQAAERRKQVVALIELKARFDEEANITWAKRLEQAGVHVMYGLVGLKTHAKCVLIVREEDDGLRRYVHVGTGNYNSSTARLYEDLGLMSADPVLGADLAALFNHLTGYSREQKYARLLDAPRNLRTRLVELIANEGAHGERGHVVAKVNSLADPAIVEAFYDASERGARVDLIVRSICCLRPGVPGMSERVTVRSILGRYLEHSRIFRFANGAGTGEPAHYMGSADLMPRNLDRRVEVLLAVERPAQRARLDEVLAQCLAADAPRWELDADASWTRLVPDAAAHSQRRLHDALQQAHRRTVERA